MKIKVKKVWRALTKGFSPLESSKKVLIVGAGIAGLSAAKILLKSGFSVQLLEAEDRWGGRMHSHQDARGNHFEMGAEEIHGKKSIWYHMLMELGAHLANADREGEDYYYFKDALQSEPKMYTQKGFEEALDYWDYLEDYPSKKAISLQSWLKSSPIDQSYHPYVLTWLENSYGARASDINVPDLLSYAKKWRAGEQNYMLKSGNYEAVLKQFFEELIPFIHLEEKVLSLDYSGEKVHIQSQKQDYSADWVLVTLPLGVLKAGSIFFQPALPEKKLEAIAKIGIAPVAKLLLQFNRAFWPEDLASLYVPSSLGEFYPSGSGPWPQLMVYINPRGLEKIAEYSEAQVLYLALDELQRIFPEQAVFSAFQSYTFKNWGKEPNFKGAYSYPSQDSESCRPILAEALENKVFFAGEASNFHGHPGTVHGAIESAYRAVKEMIKPEQEEE